jgi:uncharacterized protein (DUF1778 family)
MSSQDRQPASSDSTVHVRATRHRRDLIDRVARALAKSRSDFVLETACREAEAVLLDRRSFRLDPEAFERFTALLDNPPPTDGLHQLLHRKPA